MHCAAASRHERRSTSARPALRERPAERLEGEHGEDLGGEVVDVAELDAQHVPDDFRHAGRFRDDHRGPVLEGLEGGESERLGDGRHDEDVGARVQPVELGRGQKPGEEKPREKPRRGDALDHRGPPVARAGHDELDVGPLRRHAGGRLDEVLGALLPRDPAREEDERFPLLDGPAVPGAARVDGIVDDAQATRLDAVLAREEVGRVPRYGHDAVRRREPGPFDLGDEAAASSARAVELGRVHVEDERPPDPPSGLEPGEKRHPVVGVDDVAGLARRDLGRRGCVGEDLAREVRSVEPRGRRGRCTTVGRSIGLEELGRVGLERGSRCAGGGCGGAAPGTAAVRLRTRPGRSAGSAGRARIRGAAGRA